MKRILRSLLVCLAAGSCLPFAGCEVQVNDDDPVLEPATPDRKIDVDVDVDRK